MWTKIAGLAKNWAKGKAVEKASSSENGALSALSFIATAKIRLIIIGIFIGVAFLLLFIGPFLMTPSAGAMNIMQGADSLYGDDIKTSGVGDLSGVEAPIEPLEEGLPIPHYLQYDERWGGMPYPYNYGGSNTIAASACGPSSFAMVASYLTGQAYTPDLVLLDGRYHSEGTEWSYFEAAAAEFGVGSVTSTDNWDEVYQALQDGHPVISSQRPGLFTSGGHFIVLRGVASDGAVLVNDPNDNQDKRYVNRHFTSSEIDGTAANYWIFDAKK